jgi:formyltetrahydrofolate hydrolase
MSIEGRIAVDIGFTDTHTSASGVQTVQRLSLSSTGPHTAGKVILVAGTMTTAGLSITMPPTFRDASGNVVAMTSAHHVAYKSSRRSSLEDGLSYTIQSFDEEVAITGCKTTNETLTIARDPESWTSGTSTYCIFLFGD